MARLLARLLIRENWNLIMHLCKKMAVAQARETERKKGRKRENKDRN